MTIDSLLMAINELHDTCPDLKIVCIFSTNDGLEIYTEDEYIYRYDISSGCICRELL